jgi:hypothetical protein
MVIVYGRLEPFAETGTEGVCWAVSDRRVPGYDGLWILQDLDRLMVLDASGLPMWYGPVKLEYKRQRDPQRAQQHVGGFWVHGLHATLGAEAWANMFFDQHRAILVPGPRRLDKQNQSHPFLGPSSTMVERLRALSEERQQELYHYALYPWLSFYGDGKPYGFAIKDWGFTLEETVRLLGPTDEQIVAWKTYPRRSGDTLMPMSFDGLVRIALLCGVYGGLDWKCPTMEERIAWLNAGQPTPKELLLSGEIATVREMVEIRAP